jgi:ribosomal protein S18 acetylase RimI-like enzyme
MPEDSKWVNEIVENNWTSNFIVVKGNKYYPSLLDGFYIEVENKVLGIVSYIIENKECHIVMLNSFKTNNGIGSTLINAVINESKSLGCNRVFLITTNDNLNAINFYQKRGFDISGIMRNSVAENRKIKPTIPLLGDNGITIKHEIEMEYLI